MDLNLKQENSKFSYFNLKEKLWGKLFGFLPRYLREIHSGKITYSQCFAGASLCNPDHVFTTHSNGPTLCLDWSGEIETLFPI